MPISLSSLPHIVGACLFTILSLRIVLQPAGLNTKTANRFLFILFLIFAVMLFDEFLVSNAVTKELFIGANTLLNASHLLLGPLTYCYISSMLVKKTNIYKRLLHFTPFIFFLLLSGLVTKISSEQDNPVLNLSLIILYLATLLPYVLFSLRALTTYLGEAKSLVSNLEHHNLNWARAWLFFMLGLALYVTINPVIKVLFYVPENNFNIHYFITLVAILLLLFPDSSNQRSLADNLGSNSPADFVEDVDDIEPYLHIIYADLTKEMIEKKFYLTNGLSLSEISQYLGVTTHKVSAALNQVGAISFYDFVNNFRIECAKKLLIDHPSRAIIDIAMEAGFNSKSAFYTAFSKREELSPNQYRSKHRQEIK